MHWIPSLPLPLFRNIVAFALHDYSDNIYPMMRVFPLQGLKCLALVAKDWVTPVRDIAALFYISTLSFRFETMNRPDFQRFKRQILLKRRFVRDLRLNMGTFGSFGQYFLPHHGLYHVDNAVVDWKELFSHLPELQRLDLSMMPLSSPLISQIIEAASLHCVNMKALILPGRERQDVPLGDEIQPLMKEIYRALERWYRNGPYGGLRQLTLPSRNETDRFRFSCEYLNNVMQFCPRIEYLDGYKQSLMRMDRLTCYDEWIINLSIWESFNATCTHLKEFNWVTVPFATDFFHVFGKHMKPQLERLTFSISMLWIWTRYFHDINEVDLTRRLHNSHGTLATDAAVALKACPALKSVEVALYHPVDEDILDDPMMVYNEEYDFLATMFPGVEMVNIEIFDDEFCETLAKYCPCLERFVICEVAERYNFKIMPIERFTDRGLLALSRLRYLTSLELRSINCTGHGVFRLLNNLSDEIAAQRTFHIAIGGSIPWKFQLSFYDAVVDLLRCFTHEEYIHCVHQRFVLRLVNSSFESVDESWSKEYMGRLKPLIALVREKYPDLRLRIVIRCRRDDTFQAITELGLYTAHAEPSVWYDWDEDDDVKMSVDPVFVDRRETIGESRLRALREEAGDLQFDYELSEDALDPYNDYEPYSDYDSYSEYDDDLYDDADDDYYDEGPYELWN